MNQDKIYTDEDIANLALGYLGEQQIVSFTENTKEADLCRLHYSQIKRSLIESRRWSMGRKRSRLTQEANKPAFGWRNAYRLPDDCVRVLDVFNVEEPNIVDGALIPDQKPRPLRDFEIEDRLILANPDYLAISYIGDVLTSELSPLFIEALATKLAAKIAPGLGESRMAVQLLGLSKDYLQEAWMANVRQSRSGENSDFDYRSEFENPQLNKRYL